MQNQVNDTVAYHPPRYKAIAFHCPRCSVYAKQTWFGTCASIKTLEVGSGRSGSWRVKEHDLTDAIDLEVSLCDACNQYAIWLEEALLYPANVSVPKSHGDMPEEVSKLYNEAAQVLPVSPRAAAALLRLALQKLLGLVGCEGKNINNDIKHLMKSKDITTDMQKALDVLRVFGNNSVHPGQIDLNEDPEKVRAMFAFINYVVDGLISRKKQINMLFEGLPEKQKESIKKRDNKEVK